MYRLRFADPTASLSFRRLPRQTQLRFNATFEIAEQHPRTSGPGFDVHQLHGYQNLWTLRLHQWRGVYAIDGEEVVFVVFGHRESVYALLHHHLPPKGQYVSPMKRRRPAV